MTMSATLTTKIPIETRSSCIRCGRLGHAVVSCTFPERAIDKVGIEIEGYWDMTVSGTAAIGTRVRMFDGARLSSDGSLSGGNLCDVGRRLRDGARETHQFGDGECVKPCPICSTEQREIQSAPGSLAVVARQLTTMYPDVVSGYASTHVHMSFLDHMSVSLIATVAFHKYMRERITSWCNRRKLPADHWQRSRVRGESSNPNDSHSYCRVERVIEGADFQPMPIAGQHRDARGNMVTLQGDRYEMINYASWVDNGRCTVEFRLGAAFPNAADAVSYIEELYDLVETWIAKRGDEGIACEFAAPPPIANGPVEIVIAAMPDPPALISGMIEIPSLDLGIPTPRPGTVLATIQTAHGVGRRLSDAAYEAAASRDARTGAVRLRRSERDPSPW